MAPHQSPSYLLSTPGRDLAVPTPPTAPELCGLGAPPPHPGPVPPRSSPIPPGPQRRCPTAPLSLASSPLPGAPSPSRAARPRAAGRRRGVRPGWSWASACGLGRRGEPQLFAISPGPRRPRPLPARGGALLAPDFRAGRGTGKTPELYRSTSWGRLWGAPFPGPRGPTARQGSQTPTIPPPAMSPFSFPQPGAISWCAGRWDGWGPSDLSGRICKMGMGCPVWRWWLPGYGGICQSWVQVQALPSPPHR